MLENPEILQRIVKETGVKSTDLQSPESADHLCGKCQTYAENWKPCADKIWYGQEDSLEKSEWIAGFSRIDKQVSLWS